MNSYQKTLVLGILILFIGSSVASSSGVFLVNKPFILNSNETTLYVGGSGPGNYTKIQDAIDNATDGDTVFVYDDSSPYYENVVVDKSINLTGEDRNTTVVDGGGIDSVIEVSADYVNIGGFTVTNCRHDLSEAGINIFSDLNTIKNNSIAENQCTGIRLSGSHYNLVENNFLKDNIGYHIYLRDESNNNTVQNNTLTESDDLVKLCDGIWLSKSSGNLIVNNEITGLKFTVGISLYETSSYNVVEKNIINNNPCYGSGASIQIVGHSDFNLISNNEIRCNNGAGIEMFFSQGNEIIGNTINSIPYQGITLADCRYNNIIKFNNISSTKWGIHIGMYSSKNIVESNNLINNTYGIYLSGTDLLGFVPNNVIFKNNIVENDYGIYITVSDYYGYSNDSLIYHNNFINNSQNAFDECNNSWDNGYPSCGNYWDDYNGTDNDGDGIGDTPYYIPGGINRDRYPLMERWGGNQPPDVPFIDGPISGKAEVSYNYTFVSIDPDGTIVWYYIDWGDNISSGWIGPFNSGKPVTFNHTWSKRGTDTIQCKAKDVYGDEGPWGTLKVRMPRSKMVTNSLFLKLIEQFPLLQKLLFLLK
jgi:parallel beta-helix repeat protein